MTGQSDRSAERKRTGKWMFIMLIVLTAWFNGGSIGKTADCYMVKVESGYLALRNDTAYDYRNEIGKLYTGDMVDVYFQGTGDYWFVYSSKLDKSGFVNKNYLIYNGKADEISDDSKEHEYTVSVSSGYLALRTEKAYDYRNEIGKLFTGDTVWVLDSSDSQYWYVYSEDEKKCGYVNKDYLIAPRSTSGPVYYVTGTTYYLALRNAKAYDASNEIGKLHNGEFVNVQDTSDSTYWYVYAPTLAKYGYVNKNYLR